MKCRYVCVMDVGPRAEQEDCILIEKNVFQKPRLTNSSCYESAMIMMAVCDGMGGHDAGEEASRFVCERLNAIVDMLDFTGESLQTIMSVVQNSSTHSLPKGSGTTLAGLIVKNNKAIIFNAGDSRVYRIANGDMVCVSKDHSLVQDLIDKGMITEDEAFNHPYRNVVNFGIGPAFTKARAKYELYIYEEEITEGTCYLICSDGLSDIIKKDDLINVFGSDPVSDGEKLMETLKRIKLKDNTSYIIAEISQT